MALGELKLKWSFGYCGSPLHFVDDNVLVYNCGNTLTFVGSDGKHIYSCVSEGTGAGCLTVCQKAGLLAYCETILEPKIFILSYPSCGVQVVLEGGAQLEFGCIAFSEDGKKLASLSSLPDFKLVIWNCSEGSVIYEANIGSGGSQLSFNPLNWKNLCLIGANRICLYNLEQCDAELFLSPIEVEIPDRSMPVGSRVSPKLQSADILTDHVGVGGRQERRNIHGIVLTTPPNMKQVLYKDSYDEFLQKKSPVEPVSHCWSAQQTVYIGCEHGQLLLVDFESGIVSIAANPEVTMQRNTCSTSKLPAIEELQVGQESASKTGHALLKQGALSILTLSKRGFFMAGKDGLIQCFGVGDSLPLMDKLDVGQPIGSVAWSWSYDKLAVGTRNGTILLVDSMMLEGNGIALVSDHHFSDIVGIDVVGPGLQYFVSCRCDGILEVWDINEALVVSKLNLNTKCTTLCCPTSCSMAIAGTDSGVLDVVSLTDITTPRLVQQMFLHRNPLKYILYDQRGKFMVTMTDDGLIFLHDCRPSSHLAVLGYTDLGSTGSLLDFSIIRDSERLRLAVLSKFQDKCLVTLLTMPDHILCGDAPHDIYADATKRLSNDFVIRHLIVLNDSVSCFKLVPENTAISLTGEYLSNFTLPTANEKNMEWQLTPNNCFLVGELRNGKMISSFHQKFLGIGSIDGHIGILTVKKPERIVFGMPHCYQSGGCNCLTFSRDGQHLITWGDSGTVTCWRIKFSEQEFAEKAAAEEFAQHLMNSIKSLQSVENTALDNNIELLRCDRTWLETAKDNALKLEDDKYAVIKAELRQDISLLRERVLNMIIINEQLPDIERLSRQEFILDTEEYLQMQVEEDWLILQVTKEIELSSLASMFIREQIKTNCWDGMAVKGRMLKAFNGDLEVGNYSLKARSAAVVNEMKRIKLLQSVEAVEKIVHQDVGGELKLTLQPLHMDDLAIDDDELARELEDHAKPQQQQEGKGDTDALLGSHAAQLGGASELLYDQFNLCSSFARKHQIAIVEDCIYQIKERFNKEFDEVFRQKEMEIIRIKEKNIRIGKIIQQLKLNDALVNPTLDEDETPEKLLVVEDSEVLAEKYISPDEEKKLKEEAKQEEKRRLVEMGDNPRERALDMMMGGRLEANFEEDLFKDLPRPDFLSKDPSEMSEEEIRMARDFEKKETEFLEEREKLKKALEAELRKLQVSIVQEIEQFDERILKLFQLKIKTEMAIHQQELIILCLTKALLTEEEVTQREVQLNGVLEKQKMSKVHLGGVISGVRHMAEDFHDQYEQMVAEDRELDKSFKRDFSDCEPFIDLLQKLFRKRPRGLRLKQGPSNEGMKLDTNSQNPFAFRPSSSVGKKRALDGNDDPMAELDDISNMPEGLEYPIWDRFTACRRRKVASEQRVKAMALKLAEMSAFLNRRQAEDDHVQQLIQDTFKELNKLQEDKLISDLNLEIQFLLKQGQVEIDMGKFIPDFSNSVLVHRSRIEALNNQIKTLGEGKLHAMAECKDFKKGISMLEWEHQRMRMEAEDLVEKAKDIQLLRVTKELQRRLMEVNVTSKDQNEIDTLEKTIGLNQKMYKKSVWEYKKILSKLQSEVNDRHVQNQHLDQQLLECHVSVAEQQKVEDLAGVPLSEGNQEQRMNDIMTRQKLVETIKTQDNQISVLKGELERLRMRAFPALVQID